MSGERIFVFGFGFSARALAARVSGSADWIAGTVRDDAGAARLAAMNVRPFRFDGEAPGYGIAGALREATHVILSIPPGEAGDPALIHHGRDVMAGERLKWIGYLSTVGVYGDQRGAWVDEETVPAPARGRSTQRLAAELAWGELAAVAGAPLGVFRLAGIYGPGRNAFVSLATGKARRIVKPDQVFNRIHVADIAGTLIAAMANPARRIYNLADDEPAPPQDVIAHAAGLMGVEPPPEIPFDTADLNPMARSFYAELKRVRNDRIKAELGVRLTYPTYREGLSAMWLAGTWRG